MNSMTITWTAQIPSGSALPMCASASAVIAVDVLAGTDVVVRDRQELVRGGIKAGFTGVRGVTQAYFPGTSAWRPPIC